jgi:hypothetical protein
MDKTGQRLPALIKDAQLIVVEGGPHAIPWTHGCCLAGLADGSERGGQAAESDTAIPPVYRRQGSYRGVQRGPRRAGAGGR